MSQNWRHLPAPARPVAAAAVKAVAAAGARDAGAFDEATGELAALDASRAGLILGTLVRLLLEDGHADGLDGAAVKDVLENAVRSAMAWRADVDPHVVLLLLAGALGVTEEDGADPPKPDVLARHAALLIESLLGPRPLEPFLTAALQEIERVQLND